MRVPNHVHPAADPQRPQGAAGVAALPHLRRLPMFPLSEDAERVLGLIFIAWILGVFGPTEGRR